MFKSIRTCIVLFTFIVLFPAFSVSALAGPAITSITPDTGPNWGRIWIAELAGTGFEDGATVALVKEGQVDIEVKAMVESSTKIVGGFAVDQAEPGAWSVVVTNPDGQSATLTGGFTLTPYTPILE